MPYYNYRLPDDASDALRLAVASAEAIKALIPYIEAAEPQNREAVRGAVSLILQQHAQGDSYAATWIRDNWSPPQS